MTEPFSVKRHSLSNMSKKLNTERLIVPVSHSDMRGREGSGNLDGPHKKGYRSSSQLILEDIDQKKSQTVRQQR